MNFRNILFVLILLGVSFGFMGCGEWKPLDYSIGKQGQHHHGTGAKEHQNEHTSD